MPDSWFELTLDYNESLKKRFVRDYEIVIQGDGLMEISWNFLFENKDIIGDELESVLGKSSFMFGPIKFHIIEVCKYDRCIVCVPDSRYVIFRKIWYRISSLVEGFNSKILMTGQIWGLVKRTPGAYPGWSDIKGVGKWLKRK